MREEKVSKTEIIILTKKVPALEEKDPKRAAAIAYALGMHYRKKGESQYATICAKKAITLLEDIPSERLVIRAMNEENYIAGIAIPKCLNPRIIKKKIGV